jgi:hypothetical protein
MTITLTEHLTNFFKFFSIASDTQIRILLILTLILLIELYSVFYLKDKMDYIKSYKLSKAIPSDPKTSRYIESRLYKQSNKGMLYLLKKYLILKSNFK